MGSPVAFPATLWTTILRAQAEDPGAWNRFVARYRPPVVAFLGQRGFSPEDSEDLAQEVFQRFLEKEILLRADRAKGRLRSLVLGVTQNVIREWRRAGAAEKRGAGVRPVSGDEAAWDRLMEPREDPEFDGPWLRHLLARALERVRRDRPRYAQVLESIVKEGLDRAEVARRMGSSVKDVYNWFRRGCAKLIQALHQEIAEYASSENEYREEIAYLSRYLTDARNDLG